ncbi:MAG TPA: hypothetical protein VGK32_19955, partial [Vicinamibacterales bacterium]
MAFRHRLHAHSTAMKTNVVSANSQSSSEASLVEWLAVRCRVLAILDGGRREWWAAVLITSALVALRAAPWVLWESTRFDSDQAVIGLMAKHLSEFRAFPLFFYGQSYMLGVQAWIVAPFFWLARPSVTALRFPLMLLNVAAALFLMRTLGRELRLRPAVALIAALPFIAASPAIAGSLLDGQGCGAGELYFYVLTLWALRNKPFAFGAMFALAYLHREFTLFVLPALVIVEAAAGTLWRRSSLTRALRMAAGFGLVWLAIDDLNLHLNNTSLFMQVRMLAVNTCFRAGDLWPRIVYLFTDCLPVLFGTYRIGLYTGGAKIVGSPALGWVLFPTLSVMLARLAWTWRRDDGRTDVAAFLMLVGAFGLASYTLACMLTTGVPPMVRYLHLPLLMPIACLAAFMVREPSRRLRGIALAVFVAWGASNVADTVRAVRIFSDLSGPSPHRILADYL